ncbi:hypothetical protein [Leptospira jelokensis]|uniref:hypothetical protein n=1 Tax=Leptospira jelokensis TaxID=2484931 RepID=UPI001090F2BC|nr:hypothetical protein [Leptospira jelokensis]TGM06073.1 hypothetical protein EHQ79_01770 [Leptospira jelokensis]
MISLEIDFIFFFVSLFFFYHRFESIDHSEKKNLLLLFWFSNSIFSVILILGLSRWGYFLPGWETKSLFRILTVSNLLMFFTYNALEERIFSFGRVIGFLFQFVLYVFFSSFFFWTNLFQTNLHAEDESLILPFTISIGAFVWSREMFWTNPNSLESKLEGEKPPHLTFLFLPSFLFILSPFTTNYGFVEILSSAVALGISSFVGFSLVSQFLKKSIPREAELGMWVGCISFSSVLGVDLFVSLPISFFVGMFARGLYAYLESLSWSESGKTGVVSYLYPSIMGIFLPFLVKEPKDWSHAPYVLLGVQVLYFLSFYLVSSLVFGFLLLFKPKSD